MIRLTSLELRNFKNIRKAISSVPHGVRKRSRSPVRYHYLEIYGSENGFPG